MILGFIGEEEGGNIIDEEWTIDMNNSGDGTIIFDKVKATTFMAFDTVMSLATILDTVGIYINF